MVFRDVSRQMTEEISQLEKSHIPTPRRTPPASLQQQLALSPFPCTPSFNVVSRSVVRKVAKFLPFERPPFVPWPQNERVNIEVRGPGGLPDIGRHAPACYCVLVAKFLLSPVSLLGSWEAIFGTPRTACRRRPKTAEDGEVSDSLVAIFGVKPPKMLKAPNTPKSEIRVANVGRSWGGGEPRLLRRA